MVNISSQGGGQMDSEGGVRGAKGMCDNGQRSMGCCGFSWREPEKNDMPKVNEPGKSRTKRNVCLL